MKNVYACFLVLLMTLLLMSSSAKLLANDNDYQKFSFGIHGGPIIGLTDIQARSFWPTKDELSFGGGVMLNYHRSPIINYQATFLYGDIKGVDKYLARQYETNIIHTDITANLSFSRLLFSNMSPVERVNLFGFSGLGYIVYSGKKMDMEGNVIQYSNLLDEGEYSGAVILPYGMGLSVKLSERVDVNLKFSFYHVFSDELDAYVDVYTGKDRYSYHSVGLTFRLGRNTRSPEWIPVDQFTHRYDKFPVVDMANKIVQLEEEVTQVKGQTETSINELSGEYNEISAATRSLEAQNTQLQNKYDDVSSRLAKVEEKITAMPKKHEDSTVGTVERDRRPEKLDEFFTVQVMASKSNIHLVTIKKNLNIENFDVRMVKDTTWFRYHSGQFTNRQDANNHMHKIRKQGVLDAYVVKYKDGQLSYN